MASCKIELCEQLLTSLSSRKDCIVRFLKRNFKEHRDFTYKSTEVRREARRGGRNKKTIMVTEEVYDLLRSCYNLRSNIAIDQIRNTKITRVLMSVENSTISFICKALRHLPLTMLPQYRVASYRTDLYIPELHLCVECDEFGHMAYNQAKETNRQGEITKALSCKFLRFNPQCDDFDVADIVAEILRRYLKSNTARITREL
jgi:very-short-patch-repair endonuclease